MIIKENKELNLNKVLSGMTDKSLTMRMFKEVKNVLVFPDLKIMPDQQRVLLKNKEVVLTHTEFCILLHMAQRPGQIFSHYQLYSVIYELPSGLEGVDNIIYCLIRSLRKKIESDPRHPKYIHTVRGVGYKFDVLPEE